MKKGYFYKDKMPGRDWVTGKTMPHRTDAVNGVHGLIRKPSVRPRPQVGPDSGGRAAGGRPDHRGRAALPFDGRSGQAILLNCVVSSPVFTLCTAFQRPGRQLHNKVDDASVSKLHNKANLFLEKTEAEGCSCAKILNR